MSPHVAAALSAQLPAALFQEHLQWLLDTVPGFSYRCQLDDHWTMLMMTERVEEVLGYPAADFLDNAVRSYDSVIHPDDRQMVAETVRSATARGESYLIAYRAIARDGEVKWLHERGFAHFAADGAVAHLDGYIVDRTEVELLQSRAQPQQEQVHRHQQALVSLATSEAVARGRINEACELATGLLSQAIDAGRASIWLLDDERSQLRLVDLYQQDENQHQTGLVLSAGDYPTYFAAMRSGRLVDASDARSDPRTREFTESYLKPLGITSMLDAALRVGGEVVGVVCLEHQGPARVWSDQEKNCVGEVADQISHCLLNDAQNQARQQQDLLQEQLFRSQKLEAIGRLAGGVAHDFNNLLTIIGGFTEQLLVGRPAGDDKDDLLQIEAATLRAAELTSQLLLFSRKESVELADLDMTASLSRIERMLRRLISDNIELSLELHPQPLHILANEGLLHQMVTNLVVNAQDAIENAGRIRVGLCEHILHEEKAVEGGRLSPGRYGCLRVDDDGCGIPADVLPNVFEPFFTTKGAGAGTGLGLSTVYGIIQRCDGGVEVVSTPGEGTSFCMYFPLLDPAARKPSQRAALPPVEQAWGAGRRILVAEDNRAVLEIIRRPLQRVGFKVEAALGTHEALVLLQSALEQAEQQPALILSDMAMPGGGGVRILEWRNQHLPTVPIGFVSGYITEEETHAIADYRRLQKPFSAKTLLPFVRELLT